jgi:hypothetical protein
MAQDCITLTDIVGWISKKFESTPDAPLLNVRLDAKRRMVQFNTSWPEEWPMHTKFAYVVEGRNPQTFEPEPFFDILFLNEACRSMEALLKLCESRDAPRMTIHRLNLAFFINGIKETVTEDLWKHLTPPEAANEVTARGRRHG